MAANFYPKSNVTESLPNKQNSEALVSDELVLIIALINYAILTEVISFLSVIFNVINFIVFIKIGFKDPVNISLLGLTIADIVSMLPLIWMGMCYNPLVVKEFEHWNLEDVEHLTAGWLHVCASRITSSLTAFITFERYFCVALPLKIKSIMTRKKTIVIVCVIFIVCIIGVIPVYIGASLGPGNAGNTNHTLIGLVYAPDGHSLERISMLFSACAQLVAFALVIILTIGLVIKLKETSKVRNSLQSSSENKTMSTREKKAIKMIITIAIIFIFTYFPGSCSHMTMFCYSEFNATGLQKNIFIVVWTFNFCLESLNSAVGTFVYLKMSSNYRDTFIELFGFVVKKKNLVKQLLQEKQNNTNSSF